MTKATSSGHADTAVTIRRLRERIAELEQAAGERASEAERSQELLETRHAYLETIVQRIPAGLILAEAPSGRMTLLNERAQEILGDIPVAASVSDYAAYEGLDEDGSRLAPDEWPLARAVAGETVTRERLGFIRADGHRAVLEVNAAPVRDRRGRVVAAVCLFHDVTDVEQRERAAREFVANAAHELRTPLAAIVSAVEVLRAGAEDVPDQRGRFLAHIEREAQRLARLTRSLLTLARAQGRTEEPRLEILPLGPIVRDAATSIRPAKGVRVETACEPDVAALANPDLLDQALGNLVANAVRYTRRGRIDIAARRDGDRTIVEVSDTGRGMSAEQVARASDRFYRGGSRDGDGFGLGLSIAQQAAEAMRGRLLLHSEPGAGTTASIELLGARLVDR